MTFPLPGEPWYLSDPGVRDWIHRCYSVLFGAGSALVEALGSPNPERRGGAGLSDNCATADRLLDWLVDSGWIIPTKYEPSVCQRFFGVGGRAPGKNPREPKWRGSHTYPQEWNYRPNLDSPGLNEYVRRITGDMRSRSQAARTSAPTTTNPPLEPKPVDEPVVDTDKTRVMEDRSSIADQADKAAAKAKAAEQLSAKLDADQADRDAAKRRAAQQAPQNAGELKHAVGSLSMGTHARIVDTLFDMPDPMAEYLAIKASLTFGGRASSMSYGQLLDALDDAQSVAERASRLLANAKTTLDAFNIDAIVISGAMRQSALQDLLDQNSIRKANKESSKAPTNDDIEAAISVKFPDEYRELELKKGKARRMVAAIEALYDRAAARAGDLRTMVGKSREVS